MKNMLLLIFMLLCFSCKKESSIKCYNCYLHTVGGNSTYIAHDTTFCFDVNSVKLQSQYQGWQDSLKATYILDSMLYINKPQYTQEVFSNCR